MSKPLRPTLTDLPRGETLRVADGKSHVIAVFEGQVWLTQDGDLRDVILEAGDTFAFDSPGVTLVHAFIDARLMVLDAQADSLVETIDSVELHRRARALRDAAVGALIARGLAAAEAAVTRLARRLVAAGPVGAAPLRDCTARA
jgi:hypothetical protein